MLYKIKFQIILSNFIFITDMLNAGTRLVLVNAVYFKGQWLHKFDAELTMDMPFHVNKDTVKNVPTMYREGYYKYGELPNLNARFVVLPYKVSLKEKVSNV